MTHQPKSDLSFVKLLLAKRGRVFGTTGFRNCTSSSARISRMDGLRFVVAVVVVVVTRNGMYVCCVFVRI
jgi:hypothetical protein